MSEAAIKVKDVKKNFLLPHEKVNSLKQIILHPRRSRKSDVQHALDGVNFEVKKGDFFGIVGKNGSGKSTLLKILAGIYQPSSGTVEVDGSLVPFIELGVGFNPELTGRDNVYLNGALLGFSRAKMDEMYKEIVEFAEIEKFMDQKLKNYSSGMQVRLAFSIAIKAETDILVIDEVLAVGDAAFQKKCFDYFKKLRRDKKTVVFVSHDMDAIREYCNRAVLIDKGVVKAMGKPKDIAQEYMKLFVKKAKPGKDKSGKKEQTTDNKYESDERWGGGQAKISKLKIDVTDETVRIEINAVANEKIDNPVLGLQISGPTGIRLIETNTKTTRQATGPQKVGDKFGVSWELPNMFANGLHEVTVAVTDASGLEVYDWWNSADKFDINKDNSMGAVTDPKINVKVT